MTKLIGLVIVVSIVAGCAGPLKPGDLGSSQLPEFRKLGSSSCSDVELDFAALDRVSEPGKNPADEIEILTTFHSLRCISAKDFRTVYLSTMKRMPSADSASDAVAQAPIAFLLLDMGGRLIDRQALNWLNRAAFALRDSYRQDEVTFYATNGLGLWRVPTHLNDRVLNSFVGSVWQSQCALKDMAWTPSGLAYCPSDDICPLLRQTNADLDTPDQDLDELRDLCKNLCSAVTDLESELPEQAPTLSELCDVDTAEPGLTAHEKDLVFGCFSDIVDEREGRDRVACIARTKTSLFDLMRRNPDSQVVVSDRCKLSNNEPEPTEKERRQAEKERLEAEQQRLDELRDAAEDNWWRHAGTVHGLPGTDYEESRKAAEEAALEEMRRLESALKQLREEIEKLEEEIKKLEEEERRRQKNGWQYPTTRCAADDFGCSDSCSILDQQRQAFYECLNLDEPTGIVPSEISDNDPALPPSDPEVTDPPDDDPLTGGELEKLTACISSALDPEATQCSTLLRCADGAIPEPNEQGACVCPGGSLFVPDELPCQAIMECTEDMPCECPDTGIDGTGPGPFPGADPDAFLIIGSRE